MLFHKQTASLVPARFLNVSGLLLAFFVLSILVHGLSLLFSSEPVMQLAERRIGATIISTVLSPAKEQPTALPSHRAVPLPQPKRQSIETPQLALPTEITKPSIISSISVKNISVTSDIESKTNSETNPITAPETKIETPRTHRVSETSLKNETATIAITSTIDITPATTEQLASQLKNQRNYLLGELQSRLNRYLTYPIRARRRGWQGEVMIAFDINVGGELNNVRLTKTSGYSVLDRSAVNAINKLEKISLPDTLGRLQAMELKLPVRYQLHEG